MRARFWVEAALAALTGLLTVLTLVSREWIDSSLTFASGAPLSATPPVARTTNWFDPVAAKSVVDEPSANANEPVPTCEASRPNAALPSGPMRSTGGLAAAALLVPKV